MSSSRICFCILSLSSALWNTFENLLKVFSHLCRELWRNLYMCNILSTIWRFLNFCFWFFFFFFFCKSEGLLKVQKLPQFILGQVYVNRSQASNLTSDIFYLNPLFFFFIFLLHYLFIFLWECQWKKNHTTF